MYKWSEIGHTRKRNSFWIVSAAGRWYRNRGIEGRHVLFKAEEDRAAEPLRQVEMLGLDLFRAAVV
jgi:hypothetical protein